MRATSDGALTQRASALGVALRQEDGVANAVRINTTYLKTPRDTR